MNDTAPCPRCGAPKLRIEYQKPPARPYWRCEACGATGTKYHYDPRTGEVVQTEPKKGAGRA